MRHALLKLVSLPMAPAAFQGLPAVVEHQ